VDRRCAPGGSELQRWIGGTVIDDRVRGDDDGAAPSSAVQVRELGAFLLLLLPSLLLSRLTSPQSQPGFAVFALASILSDAALLALVLYFVWRNGEPYGRIGWRRSDLPGEAVVGVALVIPFIVFQGVLAVVLNALGLLGRRAPAAPFTLPAGGAEFAMGVVLVAVIAVAEETIFRGYLLLRLRSLTGSVPVAVVLSSVIFGLGHGYQGVGGTVAVGAIGVLLAVIYLWRGSIVAPVVLHFVQDFTGIVLAPLLGGRT
jgi:membrane protease YdiL (CAAX protease family)